MVEIPSPDPDNNVETVQPKVEVERTDVERLPEVLGFTETPELHKLHQAFVEALRSADPDQLHQAASAYHEAAQSRVEQISDPEAYKRAQTGLLVAIALLRREGGQEQDFLADMQDAYTDAYYKDLGDVVPAIASAISEAEASLGGETLDLGEFSDGQRQMIEDVREHFEPADLEQILLGCRDLGLDDDDFQQMLVGELLSRGIDPTELL